MTWHDLIDGALSLIAPSRCAGCDLPWVHGLRSFCPACEPLLEVAPTALAPPHPVAALYGYGGPLAEAIRRLKYARRHDVLGPLVQLLVERAAPHYAGRIDTVVPVPLHPRKLRARGYNQVALLARPLSRAIGARCDPDLLVRTRATRDQAGLPAGERLANVRGVFAVASGRKPGRVLLLDDVRTSGATLAEAALGLREHGTAPVACLALAATL